MDNCCSAILNLSETKRTYLITMKNGNEDVCNGPEIQFGNVSCNVNSLIVRILAH